MIVENILINGERNVYLTACLQPVGGDHYYVSSRPGIIILPGGGYIKCSEREADPVAFPYLKAGYQVFILRYSVGEEVVWPQPLQDYEDAFALIRSRAKEWHLLMDKIAVAGFSAGGHLAGCAAVLAENKPAAAVLGYAVLEEPATREGCMKLPNVTAAVDGNTCPCFVFATRDDNVVPVRNSVHFIAALTKAGVPFESHIYSHGFHGVSTGDPSVMDAEADICSRVPGWVEDSIEWLREVM